ncbi:MAG: SprT family zinc-dependent metalloprotease [Odoribacter sp.]
MEVIELSGIGEIKVRRSSNIKFLRIRMAPGRGIWVSVPFGVSQKQTEKFLEENREWIIQNQKNMEVYEQDTGVGLKIGAEIKTKSHLLKIVATDQSKPSYRMEQEVITLSVPKNVDFSRIESIVQQFLLSVYTMEARQYLPRRVKECAEKYGFHYGHLSFRNNVSNWGSCSFENNISLNIKLMKLPDEIIDYVILHELSHTIEKNHSAAFWKLVGKICPDYLTLRNRLRKYNTRI